eukprot:maker-scaffold_1-snap-gene-24.13-mRNA-1 protein AED:0.00 eAED:0.00 QI:62/1/1/1/1/1/2/124/440
MNNKPKFDPTKVNEDQVAADEYLRYIQLSLEAQIKVFATRFVFMLKGPGVQRLYNVAQQYEQALTKHWTAPQDEGRRFSVNLSRYKLQRHASIGSVNSAVSSRSFNGPSRNSRSANVRKTNATSVIEHLVPNSSYASSDLEFKRLSNTRTSVTRLSVKFGGQRSHSVSSTTGTAMQPVKLGGNRSPAKARSRVTRQRISGQNTRLSHKSPASLNFFDAPAFKQTYLPLNSTQLSVFLEKMNKVKNPRERKAAFGGLLNEEGGLPLLGYLLFHFRREILREYFLRRKENVPRRVTGQYTSKPLGNKEVGYETTLADRTKTLAQALKEELFLRTPFGHDPTLDEGLYQYNAFIAPIQRTIVLLQESLHDPEISVVRKNTARTEIKSLLSDLEEAFNGSYVLIDAYVQKLKKSQKTELNKHLESLVGKTMHRQMTLARFSSNV